MRGMYGRCIALTDAHLNREWKSFNHLTLEPHSTTAAKLGVLFSMLHSLLPLPEVRKLEVPAGGVRLCPL